MANKQKDIDSSSNELVANCDLKDNKELVANCDRLSVDSIGFVAHIDNQRVACNTVEK